ncbi:PTS sugar transporter subunit IIB [Enterococcus faecalis]|uniref:PTS sugar transporter subunit IIB n=1 Tax=Enterococcus faecalis TaxID=1351 RepID=UPI0022E35F54|nr:hypothetical protein [Enterococcus faecalis]
MAKKTIMLVCSAGMSTSLLRFMKGQFEQKLQPKGIPLDVINMADYGMMNGEKVLDQAISLMG